MKNNPTSPQSRTVNRRDFIKTSSAVSAAAVAAGALAAPTRVFGQAGGSDKIRIGVVGCGGRGTGAAIDCTNSSKNVEIVAMGDLFRDRVDGSLNRLKEKCPKGTVNVPADQVFTGFDNYKQVIACDVDMLIFATPPGFRPIHLRAAVEAGKNVFMEKPVAVDPAGVRSVIESAEIAKKKRLAIVAGTQRRHQNHYLDLMKRVQDGAIGDLVGGQCYWNQGGLWVKKQDPSWSDMEWQCRNWLYFTWLSGDHICEQHIHNIDVINWAMGGMPVSAMGMGGREVRTGAEYGNIFDHFAIEYTYANGAKVQSMCRQTPGCTNRVSERVVGSKGVLDTSGGGGRISGQMNYRYEGPNPNPYVQEHADLIKSIRDNKPLNEAKRVAESTLTAIVGRMSAYTGRELKLEWALQKSKLDIVPKTFELGDIAVPPVSVPGKTELI